MKYFYIIALLLVIGACAKDQNLSKYAFNSCLSNCIQIDGTLRDASNLSLLSDVKVQLIYKVNGGPQLSELRIGEVVTDNTGSYALNFAPDLSDFENGYYQLVIEKSGYIEKKLLLRNSLITSDSEYTIDNYLIPEGELSILFNNKTAFNVDDQITYRISYLIDQYKNYININEFELTGSGGAVTGIITGNQVDTSCSYVFPAGEYVRIEYSVQKNGLNTSGLDSVMMHFNRITEYVLEY